MFNRWRDEIETGRRRADELAADMKALAWGMIRAAFVLGLAIGLMIGGIAWLMK